MGPLLITGKTAHLVDDKKCFGWPKISANLENHIAVESINLNPLNPPKPTTGKRQA